MSIRFKGIFNIFFLLYQNNRAHRANELYILPHLGYGDLITCMPIFLQMVADGKKIHVFSPGNAIPFLLKLKGDSDIEFLAIEECLSESEFPEKLMIYRGFKFAQKRRLPILTLGYDLLWLSTKIRPDLDINTVFYRIAKQPLQVYRRFDVSSTLRNNNSQLAIPKVKYALVDHFPDTNREIHPIVFKEIQNRGLEIVHNPREVKYESLVDLIENASELHLVNSSLLCVALQLNNKANQKFVYPINKNFYPGLYFYDHSWSEYALNSDDNIRYPRPKKIDRFEEHQILINKSHKSYLRFLDCALFRNHLEPYKLSK